MIDFKLDGEVPKTFIALCLDKNQNEVEARICGSKEELLLLFKILADAFVNNKHFPREALAMLVLDEKNYANCRTTIDIAKLKEMFGK